LRDLLNDKDDDQKLEIKLVEKPVMNTMKKSAEVKVQEVDVPNLTTVLVTSGNQVSSRQRFALLLQNFAAQS
jgi:hypothetical protein